MSRSLRYFGLIDQDLLADQSIFIVGCGAVGSAIARDLAAIGFTNFQLCDPDDVEEVNLGPQAFHAAHLGLPKAEALAAEMSMLNPLINVGTDHSRFTRGDLIPDADVVFAAVDCLRTRLAIHEAFMADDRALMLVDARLDAYDLDLYSMHKHMEFFDYAATINPDGPSPSIPCTERMTRQTTVVAAAYAIQAYWSMVQNREFPNHLTIGVGCPEIIEHQPTPQRQLIGAARCPAEEQQLYRHTPES